MQAKRIILVYPHEYVPERINLTQPSKVMTVISKKEGGHKWPNTIEAPDPLDYPEDVLGLLQDIKAKFPNALFVPFMEEVVLDCAFVNQNIDKVLKVVDRYQFREELWYKHYSVNYNLITEKKKIGYPLILKARSSALSKGVELIQKWEDIEPAVERIKRNDNYYLSKLQQYQSIPVNEQFILEECVAPDSFVQYEINGVIANKTVRFYDAFLQKWSVNENKRIVSYERYFGKIKNDIIRIVKDAIVTFDLDNTCFCAELRLGKEGLKLIEINLRLGEEDKKYYQLFHTDIFTDSINFLVNNY